MHNIFVPIERWVKISILTFLSLYALFVIGMALYNVDEGGSSVLVVCGSGLWFVFCTCLPLIFYKKEYGYCHPLVVAALLALPSIVLRETGLFTLGLTHNVMLDGISWQDLNYLCAYGYFLRGLAALMTILGYQYLIGRSRRQILAPVGQSARPVSGLVYVFLGLTFLVSFGAFYILCGRAGGLIEVVTTGRGLARAEGTAGISGHLVAAVNLSVVTAILWSCFDRRAFRNPIFLAMAASSCIMAYLSDGRRSDLIYPIIMLSLCYVMVTGRVPKVTAAVFCGLSILLVGILGQMRVISQQGSGFFDIQSQSIVEYANEALEEMTSRSGSRSVYYPVLERVPGDIDLLYGRGYLEYLYIFIPRVFWPDKPRGIDYLACQTFYGGTWGMPPGGVGEAYWNFHILGVIGVFFLYGMFNGYLASWVVSARGNSGVMAVYLISAFYLYPAQGSFRRWMWAVVPAIVIISLGRLGQKRG